MIEQTTITYNSLIKEFSVFEKKVLGVITFLALASLAIGITALIGINGHSIGPFHALTAMEPPTAWTLVGLGCASLIGNIVYIAIRHLKKYHYERIVSANALFQQSDVEVIFSSLNKAAPPKDALATGKFFIFKTNCAGCNENSEKDTCSNQHSIVIFKLKGTEKEIVSVKADQDGLSKLINELYDNGYLLRDNPELCGGIDWRQVTINCSANIKQADYMLDQAEKEEISKQLLRLNQEKKDSYTLMTLEKIAVIAVLWKNKYIIFIYTKYEPEKCSKLTQLHDKGLGQI